MHTVFNPPVLQLLSPERSLVVCFNDKGAVSVNRRLINGDGGFDQTFLGNIARIAFELGFEFGVDEGSVGLMVETDSVWNIPWDEDRVSVLGGPPFAFGNGPVGASENFDPKIRTRRIRTGKFSNPTGSGSKVTITGLHHVTESSIPPGVPEKFFSLWLPPGSTGYFKFTNWETKGKEMIFKSS